MRQIKAEKYELWEMEIENVFRRGLNLKSTNTCDFQFSNFILVKLIIYMSFENSKLS